MKRTAAPSAAPLQLGEAELRAAFEELSAAASQSLTLLQASRGERRNK